MPYISENTIEKIKQRLTIVDVISDYVRLKKSGQNYVGLCPFHIEKTPSFFVNEEKGVYHCFGCGASGNMFNFIMKIENVTFPESLKILAKKAGIEIEFTESGLTETSKEKELIYKINQEAMFIYNFYLKTKSEAEKANELLKKREINPETINIFNLGYALPEFNKLYNELLLKKYSPALMLKAGLIRTNEKGEYIDRFRNRIIFPIKDVNDNVIGFGGRIIDDNENAPKYINTPETIVFQKRKNLFGLNLSKNYIREKKQAIIVEGYFDVISLYQNGIKNVVAPLGTALTEEQLLLLKRYADEIVLLFDSDKAGNEATIRSISILLKSDLNIKVVELPLEYDPDLFVRKFGSDKLKELINNAPSFLKFVISYSFKKYGINTISGKKQILKQLFSVISFMTDEIKKSEVLRFLSEKLKINESSLRKEYENFLKKGVIEEKVILKTKKNTNILNSIERAIPVILLETPEYITSVYNTLQISELSDDIAKKILSIIYEYYENHSCLHPDKIFEMIEDENIKSIIAYELIKGRFRNKTEKYLNDYILKIKINNINKKLKTLSENLKSEKDFSIIKKIEEEIQKLYKEKEILLKNKEGALKIHQ